MLLPSQAPSVNRTLNRFRGVSFCNGLRPSDVADLLRQIGAAAGFAGPMSMT